MGSSESFQSPFTLSKKHSSVLVLSPTQLDQMETSLCLCLNTLRHTLIWRMSNETFTASALWNRMTKEKFSQLHMLCHVVMTSILVLPGASQQVALQRCLKQEVPPQPQVFQHQHLEQPQTPATIWRFRKTFRHC